MSQTNGRELGALALAFAIRIALAYLASMMLTHFYLILYRSGGPGLMMVGTTIIAAFWLLLTLPLFLLLRAWFGGVPPTVAPPGREHAFTSRGGEIATYLLACLVDLILFMLVNYAVTAPIYRSLRAGGNPGLVIPAALAVSVVSALILGGIFLLLRHAMIGSEPVTAAAAAPALAAAEPGAAPSPAPAGPPMGFGGAVSTCFRKYAVFSGRARRPEYWFWVLFQVPVLIVVDVLDLAIFGIPNSVFSLIAAAALFLPSLGVQVRRLHDIDRSGWFILLGLIPLVGGFILLIMACTPSTVGANRFGPEYA